MNQQINLYQPMFRREKKVFSSAAMAQLGLLAAFGLMAIYGYSFWQTREVEQHLGQLVSEQGARRVTLAKLEAKYPVREQSKLLQQQIELKTEALRSRKEILAVLSGGAYGDLGGFADHFEALARRHVEGTWLERVKISDGGAKLGISGRSLFPELVPIYIQRLSDEEVFAGTTFNVLEVTLDPQDGRNFVFLLDSVDAGRPQ